MSPLLSRRYYTAATAYVSPLLPPSRRYLLSPLLVVAATGVAAKRFGRRLNSGQFSGCRRWLPLLVSPLKGVAANTMKINNINIKTAILLI